MTITARSIRRRKQKPLRGRFESAELQILRAYMTNHEATLWARAGYPPIGEFCPAAQRRLDYARGVLES